MKKIENLFLIVLIFLVPCLSYPVGQKGNSISLGEYVKIHSNILKEERTLLVKYPDDYSESKKRYPVVFQLDGYKNAYFLRLAEMTRLQYEGSMPDAIYIAIANTDRNRDMYPFRTVYHKTSGGADNFIRFISEELIPFVNQNFRTTHHKTLMGFSASGAFVLYLMMKHPEIFDAYVACSPSISFNTKFFIDELKKFVGRHLELKKTLAVVYGSAEGNEYYGDQHYFDMKNAVRQITGVLKNKSPKNFTWNVISVPGGKHVPNGCVHEGLKSVFQGWVPVSTPEIIPSGGYCHFSQKLQIKIRSNGGRIYHTKDQSDPTPASAAYTGSIFIDGPVNLKARVFGEYGMGSDVAEGVFKKSPYFNHIDVKGQLLNGLSYRYYENYFYRSRLPEFKEEKICQAGITDGINLSAKRRVEGFGLVFSGYIKIPQEGDYVFYLSSNDESRLSLDKRVIVFKSGDYGSDEKSGIVPLEKGLHRISVEYVGPAFRKKLYLKVQIKGPGMIKQAVLPSMLFHQEK